MAAVPRRLKLPLETERLIIRPLRTRDAEPLHAVWSDPETMRYIPTEPDASLADSRARVRRQMERFRRTGLSLWAVEERATGEVVGCAGLFPVEGVGPDVEVAYHLARPAWGRGLATEAARACVEAGLRELRLPRIYAFAFPENRASIRVMEKIGMRYAGRARMYGHELVKYATDG